MSATTATRAVDHHAPLSSLGMAVSVKLKGLQVSPLNSFALAPTIPWGQLAIDNEEARERMLAVFAASPTTVYVDALSSEDKAYLVACLRGAPLPEGTLAHVRHVPAIREIVALLTSANAE